MWYVLQTLTGREEEVAGMVRRAVPPGCYEACFVAYYERVWRRQQRSIVHVERLFPGYVFVVTDVPQQLYLELKHIPAMSHLLSDGGSNFLHLSTEEEAFLECLFQCRGDGSAAGPAREFAPRRTVKLSYVETDGAGNVSRLCGPLEHYSGQVVRYQFKKRYAIIRLRMLGMEKTAVLGILLKEDIRQGLVYGKVETPGMAEMAEDADDAKGEGAEVSCGALYQAGYGLACGSSYQVGEHVRVTAGGLEGMDGVIRKRKKDRVAVGVCLFGQEVLVEVAEDEVCGWEKG